MDKETFFTITPSKRVEEVNLLLQKYELKEIANLIGVPQSTFSKVMREGDYFYHQSDRIYYPFVRSENERLTEGKQEKTPELEFIKEHFDALKGLIRKHQSKTLILDERVYNRHSKFVAKSIRMNNSIYEEFGKFCEEHYPHLKTQDMIAQSLLEFMERYKR